MLLEHTDVRMVRSILCCRAFAGFKTEADAEMVAAFFAKHAASLPSAKRAISQSVEAINGKSSFHAENLDDVKAFFAAA